METLAKKFYHEEASYYTIYSVQFGNQFPIQFEIGSQSTVLSVKNWIFNIAKRGNLS